MISREPLLAQVQARHSLAVIALESLPGFGRTVLLEQALARGPFDPRDRDVLYRCGPGDASDARLARNILDLLLSQGAVERDVGTPFKSAEPGADAVAEALAMVAGPDSHVALCIDDVERCREEGADLLAALVHRLPERCHLVLSGRRLPKFGLARLVAAGDAVLIGRADLSFDREDLSQLGGPDVAGLLSDHELASWPALASLMLQGHNELIVDYVTETVLPEIDPLAVRGLAALVAVGGVPQALVEPVLLAVLGIQKNFPESLSGVDLGGIWNAVVGLPLVTTEDGCWPHLIWKAVTSSELSAAQRDAAVLAKIHGLISIQSIHGAGQQAVEHQTPTGLVAVVRAALSTQPPRASVADLRSWLASDLLPVDGFEGQWLKTVVDLQSGDRDGSAIKRLEEVRQAFEAVGDAEGEVSVLLHLGMFARANSDNATLAFLLQRADALAQAGNPTARVLVALGQALTSQLLGSPTDAISTLEGIPPGALSGEWASQALMMRGTNLLLAGRLDEALDALHSSTGEGSPHTRSIAHDLLSTVKWYSGNPLGAIEEAETAERLALSSATAWVAGQRTVWKACMLAAIGQTAAATQLIGAHPAPGDSGDDETEALARITETLILCDNDQLHDAEDLLIKTNVPLRATRAATWKTSLGIALSSLNPKEEDENLRHDLALRLASSAGAAGGRYLAESALAHRVFRPYLPASWCERDPSTTSVVLIGRSEVWRDGVLVEHRLWSRNRVRELLLHLVLVESATRSLVAADLWPDLLDRDAGRNLRVTLTHLLDVLDPDRPRAGGSAVIVDTEGRLSLSRPSGLRVDVWEQDGYAKKLMATPDHERETLLAHARRLVTVDWGRLLGGMDLGEWVEPYRRAHDELRMSALLRGAAHALTAADYSLTEDLVAGVLQIDPWSEQAHDLLIGARIDSGDIDGARRAFLQAMAAFHDLGVTPRLAVDSIAHRLGLSFSASGVPDQGRRKVHPLGADGPFDSFVERL
jgi:LuxR family maltose regulon positive regulatory protein